MKNSVAKKLIFSYVVILVLFAGIIGASFYGMAHMQERTRQIVEDTIPLERAATNIYTQLVSQETGVRGYIVTRNERYLDSYNTGKRNIKKELEALEPYFEAYPRMAEIIKEAKPKIKSIETFFEDIIKLVKEEKMQEAQYKMGEGKFYFDSFIITNKEIYNEIDKLINEARVHSQQAQKKAQVTLIVASIIALAITIIMAYLLIKSISKPAKTISSALLQVAEGDLTVDTIQIKNKDEIGIMVHSFNKMVGNLKELILKIGDNSDQIAAMAEELTSSADQNTSATEQIAMTIQEIATGANVQVDKVDDTNSIVNEFSKRMQQITSNTQSVSSASLEATHAAHDGYKNVQHAVDQMNAINTVVSDSAQVVGQLGGKLKKIGDIIEIITNISDQTNLLALNAAIEAARAGEAGRGFAVVAEEVRKLAEQSGGATVQIAKIIEEIQTDAQKAIDAMENGTQAVEKGTELAQNVGDVFDKILASIENVSGQIQEVAASVQDMTKDSEQIANNMYEVFEIAQTSSSNTQTAAATAQEQAASMEEIAASANTLASMAEELQELVVQFKLPSREVVSENPQQIIEEVVEEEIEEEIEEPIEEPIETIQASESVVEDITEEETEVAMLETEMLRETTIEEGETAEFTNDEEETKEAY
ncbi:methyl-accepting chemotaxis protein [Clostridiaceae bacterium 35-E11]